MKNFFSHSSAEVNKNSKIGKNTKIWNNAQIRENVIIGKNCTISKDVYIDNSVRIGNNCKIQNGVSVFKGVCIKNNVFIGPNVTFTNDKYPRADNIKWKLKRTTIENGSSIGANSTILCGIKIGKYSMIGAGSVVTKNVEAYSLVYGNPAKFIYYINKKGEKISF